MTENEYEALLKAVKRIERKLDIVIRAIYEHDEGITDDYGRTQRSIEAGRRSEDPTRPGDILGLTTDIKPDSGGQTNPPRDNGKVEGERSIPRDGSKNQNVPRKNGRKKHWKDR